MGERETSHCRDFHPTSYQQLVRLHPRRQERQVRNCSIPLRPLRLCERFSEIGLRRSRGRLFFVLNAGVFSSNVGARRTPPPSKNPLIFFASSTA
jgi:hypothetical protein